MRVATFNVRGISKEHSKRCLEEDALSYHCDILAIQETKAKESSWKATNGWGFYLQKHEQVHYGLGFGFSPKFHKYVEKVWRVNDRISAALLSPFKKKVGSKLLIVNTYLPTMQITKRDHGTERDNTLDIISNLIKQHKRDIIMILGDFNCKVGRNCLRCTG